MLKRAVAPSALALLAVLAVGARGDEKADALLQRVQAATRAVTSLQGEQVVKVETADGSRTFGGTFKVMRPNIGTIRQEGTGRPTIVTYSDGKIAYYVNEGIKEFQKLTLGATSTSLPGAQGPLAVFFNPASITARGGEVTVGAPETIDGKTYQVLVVAPKGEGPRQRFFVNDSGLVEGHELSSGTTKQTHWIKSLKLNEPLKATEFAYAPPAGFKAYEPPDFEKSLVAVGKPAPFFQLPRPDGSEVSLENTLKGKKAVLVNFWFYN